jgi:hypothetical protein
MSTPSSLSSKFIAKINDDDDASKKFPLCKDLILSQILLKTRKEIWP